MVGVNNIEKFLSSKELNEISEEVKNAAYEIIDKKGVTCYGIGMCLTRLSTSNFLSSKSLWARKTKLSNSLSHTPALFSTWRLNSNGLWVYGCSPLNLGSGA